MMRSHEISEKQKDRLTLVKHLVAKGEVEKARAFVDRCAAELEALREQLPSSAKMGEGSYPPPGDDVEIPAAALGMRDKESIRRFCMLLDQNTPAINNIILQCGALLRGEVCGRAKATATAEVESLQCGVGSDSAMCAWKKANLPESQRRRDQKRDAEKAKRAAEVTNRRVDYYEARLGESTRDRIFNGQRAWPGTMVNLLRKEINADVKKNYELGLKTGLSHGDEDFPWATTVTGGIPRPMATSDNSLRSVIDNWLNSRYNAESVRLAA